MFRKSPRSEASYSGPRASHTHLHKKRAAGHEKKICVPDSGTAQTGQSPTPGPCRFSTYVPEGRRSRSSCQTKILIFSGSGSFHKWEYESRVGERQRARYSDLEEKTPSGQCAMTPDPGYAKALVGDPPTIRPRQ